MGRLIYGGKVDIDVDDQSLFHLDAVIMELRGAAFQVHITLGGANDWDLLSLSVGNGAPLVLQYANTPSLSMDYGLVLRLAEDARNGRMVTLPIDFQSREVDA